MPTRTSRKTTKKICRKPTATRRDTTRHAYATIAVSPSTAITESDTTFFLATRRGAALRPIRKIFKSTSRAQKVDGNAGPQLVSCRRMFSRRIESSRSAFSSRSRDRWPLATRSDAMRCASPSARYCAIVVRFRVRMRGRGHSYQTGCVTVCFVHDVLVPTCTRFVWSNITCRIREMVRRVNYNIYSYFR